MCTGRHNPDEVWAIRIKPNSDVFTSNEIPADFFENIKLNENSSHPIFSQGEACPVSERIGIPLIICKLSNGSGPNEIAVKLRIEVSDGFAPAE